YVLLSNPQQWAGFSDLEKRFFQENKAYSAFMIPMSVKGNLIGWISFLNTQKEFDWKYISIEPFSNIANIFINVFERKKYENKIQNLHISLEQKITEKTNELSTLLNIQKALTSELHVDHVIQIIADEACRLTNTQLSTLYFFENGKLIVKTISGIKLTSLPIGFEIPIEGSLAGVAFNTGSPYLIKDVSTATGAFKEAVRLSNAKSILFVPLVSGRRTIGVISVADKVDGELGYEDEQLLKMFANSAIIALDNARLYKEEHDRREEAERRRRIAEALRDILRMLNTKTDLPELLNYIADQSRELLFATSTMIRRINYEENLVATEASSNLPDEFSVIQDLPFYSGGSELILKQNKPVAVSNLQDSLGRYLDDPQELTATQQLWAIAILRYYKSHLIVPLIIDGNLYGTMTFYYENQTQFSEEDIYLGLTLASQVALAIENARLRNQEKEMAIVNERNRLARDLHDAVTQTLFSATLIAEVIPRLWKKNIDEGEKRLEELRQLTRGALAEMRTLLLELRPSALKDASFPDLIKQLSEALSGRTRIPVEIELGEIPELDQETKIALYRICQEAFNNVAKHSDASHVWISLGKRSDRCELTIKDNGKGMDGTIVPSNHLGISIMKERAQAIGADINFMSEPGSGTTISLLWDYL
ncbi:MAG TPA: GAF domain-containing sensor histidine kinase, partial [Anaerolineaceae bacterium]|nr:GAF domain-containing sensor histidine kinase [Anaerolineaceae bacterium]